jgi:hypothetical protein
MEAQSELYTNAPHCLGRRDVAGVNSDGLREILDMDIGPP